MKLRLATIFTLLLTFYSLIFGQATVVHNGNNSIIHFGLVAEYRLTESGQQGFNTGTGGSTTATTNLVGFPEQAYTGFSGGTTTPWAASNSITDNFAVNPIDGQTTAARWVSLGSTPQLVGQHPTLSAAQYTFSIYAKSNTGSTQKIRLAYHNSGGDVFSSDLSVTTSWQQLSFTSTSATTITQVYMPYNDVAQDALDILIYGPKIEAGASATAYVPADGYAQMGNYLSVDSFDPTRSASTGINTSAGALAVATFSTPLSLSANTTYAVVKWSGGITAQAYYEIVTEHWAAQQYLLAGRQNGNPATYAFGSTSLTSQSGKLNDSNWHLVTGVYSSGSMKLYIDNMEIGSSTPTGLTQSLRQLVLGATPDELNFWLGNIAYLSIYNTGHSLAQIQQNQVAIQNLMTKRSITINDAATSRYYVAEGDSITDFGNLGRQGYYYLASTGTALTVEGQNVATSGATISTLTGRLSTVAALYNSNRKSNTLSILLGANDLNGFLTPAQFVANYKVLLAAYRAMGYKVLVGTILPQKNPGSANPNFIADRNAANALMLADPDFTNGTVANGFIDFAANGTIGCDACGNDVTMYPDGLHPSAACAAIMAPIDITALQAIY